MFDFKATIHHNFCNEDMGVKFDICTLIPVFFSKVEDSNKWINLLFLFDSDIRWWVDIFRIINLNLFNEQAVGEISHWHCC